MSSLVSLCACVCLTIFISIFSLGADFTTYHLDVFAAGAAVELVDPVVSPTHGVSHLRLVLHMHAEVDSIHTEYLLRSESAQRSRGGTRCRMEKHNLEHLVIVHADAHL